MILNKNEDIKIFNNFINKKDLLILNKEINFLKTNHLIKRSKFAGRLILENVEINSMIKILKKYNKKIVKLQKKYFNIKESYPIEMFVSIFEPGDHLSEHVDTDGKYKFFELACVLYLNDFEEGDICFPNLKYSYKPKKSDLIIFPCDGNKSLHKTIISKDERITISAWYGFDKNKQIGYLK